MRLNAWYTIPRLEVLDGDFRDQLLTEHEEFRKLAHEHNQYSTHLDLLTEKRYLTNDEKLEEVRLKKLIRIKDQMESIERQYRQAMQHGQSVGSRITVAGQE